MESEEILGPQFSVHWSTCSPIPGKQFPIIDDNFKAFYDRLIVNGKQTTQVQIAVMRKMIITAHSLYKNNRKYDVNFGINEDDLSE